MTTADQITTITAHMPKKWRSELDALTKSTGRNKNGLIEEALRRFVEVERWQIDLIEERSEYSSASSGKNQLAVTDASSTNI